VLDAHNLIWVSARASGNDVAVSRRVLFALMSQAALRCERETDWARISIAGFSGGGRTASVAAATFPALFKGGLYICGANWNRPDEATVAAMRANRFVFVTGSRDFNNGDVHDALARYRGAGLADIMLLDLLYLGHQLPRAPDFERAVRFLDRDAG
jgi:poly(3-hydroxybutyrate) depolymerase